MPIPRPKQNEKQSAFMVRCVPQLMKYHDKEQAIAICYKTFKDKMIDKKVEIDLDNDGKPDIKIDFKTILIVGGMIVSMTMGYTKLQSEIEIAKTLPQAQEINIEIIEQKIAYFEKELEKFEAQAEKRIEALEKKVYKK